ncbi:MAG: CfrBI family restriction endonuclease [bacterium]|nr:CfrBI family restriction endonuclease [bacterium]
MKSNISSNIPQAGISLASYSGKKVIERVGEDIIKEVVTSVLCGENVRALTESLTRRRLALSNAALLIAYIKSQNNIDNIIKDFPKLVRNELNSKISKEKKLFLTWFIGLTGKSIQNVLRSDDDEFDKYLEAFETALSESSKKCNTDYGELKGTLEFSKNKIKINWPSILYLFSAIGAQTLAIRGSEKSMYGKLFEKLILGSLLSILGFKLINPTDTTKQNKVFWLSSRGDKRESDATVLFRPGIGIRFDIGFIGPGNTEISLDKVSRFEREMEHGRQLHYMSTIIIVDRIGDRSRILEMAKAIDGSIVQMSMTYWIKDVCEILRNKIGFRHKILSLAETEIVNYIEEKMKKIDLNSFINNNG